MGRKKRRRKNPSNTHAQEIVSFQRRDPRHPVVLSSRSASPRRGPWHLWQLPHIPPSLQSFFAVSDDSNNCGAVPPVRRGIASDCGSCHSSDMDRYRVFGKSVDRWLRWLDTPARRAIVAGISRALPTVPFRRYRRIEPEPVFRTAWLWQLPQQWRQDLSHAVHISNRPRIQLLSDGIEGVWLGAGYPHASRRRASRRKPGGTRLSMDLDGENAAWSTKLWTRARLRRASTRPGSA